MSRAALERLAARFPEAVSETHAYLGNETAVIRREWLKPVMRVLRDDAELRFDQLIDLTCVDYPGRALRFEVVYHLRSTGLGHRLRIKAGAPADDPTVETVTDLWPAANWAEREVWDLYGVRFDGHPDLRRILLYEEFVGHPLRKDYPTDKRQPLTRRPDLAASKRPPGLS